jgi:hypothetical protein
MEEERARHAKGGRGFNGLNALDEDEEENLDIAEDDDDDGSTSDSSIDEHRPEKKKQTMWGHVAEDQLSAVQRDMQKTAISKDAHHHRHKQPAPARKTPATKRAGGFELNMAGATLLSRRGKGMDANADVGSDGGAKAASKALKVAS